MVFSRKKSFSDVFNDDNSLVISHYSLENLGVILDCNLSLEEQIWSTAKKKILFFIFATFEKFINILMKKTAKY